MLNKNRFGIVCLKNSMAIFGCRFVTPFLLPLQINRFRLGFLPVLAFIFLTVAKPSNSQQISITQPGAFAAGVNYWALYAGTNMWRDWRPDIIEQDFKQLSENGIKVLRVFPLWPDFQPIHKIYTAGGKTKYVALKNGQPLPSDGS